MRFVPLLLVVTIACGCDKAQESADEKAVEIATGGKVKIDGDKITVQGKDGKTTYTQNKEGVEIKSKDASVTFGKSEIPKGFPLKVYPGSKVLQAMDAKQGGKGQTYHVTTQVTAPLEKVVAHYEKAFKDKGLEVKRTEINTGEVQTVLVNGKSDKVEAMVSVVKNAKEKAVTTTIAWKAKP
jgi:hypothetical protein